MLLSIVAVPLVKVIAPSPGEFQVQVKSVKVTTPADAAFVVVPPIVHVPVPAFAVAVTSAVADVPSAQIFPYWSLRVTTGWVANASPLTAPAAGCWVTTRLATAPAVMVCDTVESLYPAAVITTLPVAGVLSAEFPPLGFKVTLPLDTS